MGAAATVGEITFCRGSSDSSGPGTGGGRTTLAGEAGTTESGGACT